MMIRWRSVKLIDRYESYDHISNEFYNWVMSFISCLLKCLKPVEDDVTPLKPCDQAKIFFKSTCFQSKRWWIIWAFLHIKSEEIVIEIEISMNLH